ncbi:MAG TPA: hypothetical protein VMX12_03185 [Acidimicrobiia bacterium]|nr:hypothetical protein [Acidimicrobiia bacterium]
MGEWLPPEEPEHRCDLPEIGWGTGVGARWRCECGAVYVVEELYQAGESWKQFRRTVRPV